MLNNFISIMNLRLHLRILDWFLNQYDTILVSDLSLIHG